MDQFGSQKIQFEWNDRGTLMHLGDYAAHWANLLGEIIREFPMHFRSWLNIPEERKAGVLGMIRGSRSLAVLRDRQMESFATREYPSLIQTYFDTHTVYGLFLRDEERLLYREGEGTSICRPSLDACTPDVDDLKRTNKQLKKHIDMMMKVLRTDDKISQLLTQLQSQHEVDSGSGIDGGEDDEPSDDENAGEEEEDEDS
ncbi:hypothetical protein Tco_0616544 [Tanacetum coccineum]